MAFVTQWPEAEHFFWLSMIPEAAANPGFTLTSFSYYTRI